jgi:hypothetical protein
MNVSDKIRSLIEALDELEPDPEINRVTDILYDIQIEVQELEFELEAMLREKL